MSLDSIGATGAAARIAAIQQMASALGTGPAAAQGFGDALSSATASGGAQATTMTGGAVNVMPYAGEITKAAQKYGIDPSLLAGLVKQESGFNPNARSAAGAVGLTQLMPATAKALGVTNPIDPLQSLEGGAKYLRQQLDRFGGNERFALAAYNAGPGAVGRYGGVPPYAETQNYVKTVLANRDAFARTASAAALTTTGTAGLPTGLPSATALSTAALDTGDQSSNTSNLPLSTSSTSLGGGTSSPLPYPTT